MDFGFGITTWMQQQISMKDHRNSSRAIWAGIIGLCLATVTQLHAQIHPLDPLSSSEISAALATLRAEGKLKGGERFPEITLLEAPKQEVLDWRPGKPFRREAFVSVYDLKANRLYEARVDVRAGRILSWKAITGAGPLMTEQENYMAIEIARASPEWQAAMRRRGITNWEEVALSPWMPGHLALPGAKGARLTRVLSYYQRQQKNSFGPPIEGVEIFVDLALGKVVHAYDTGARPLPTVSTDYFDPAVRGTNRIPLKPMHITQPEGTSFTLRDNEVSWDRWRFRIGFNTREGLVIYQVRYEDGGRERSILYRGSVSEMLVPYGDPDVCWAWRNAFDEGEYGLGKLGAPLIAGQNAAAHATLLSPVMANDLGDIVTFTNRVEIFEQPGAGLWSHWEYAAGPAGRRMAELWVGFTATVGNYDYSYHWIFRTDASIEVRVELNGILLMKGVQTRVCQACQPKPASRVQEPREDRFGTLVAPNIVAPNHQHFISMRLDFDIDGVSNTVKEINVQGLSRGRANPNGNAIEARSTVLLRERAAARDASPSSQRSWVIVNPNYPTELGHFPGYALMPKGNAVPFLHKNSPVRRIAGFIDHQFFTTRYRSEEQFAAGNYPTLSVQYESLRDWVRDDESIVNQDVVIWYTLGVTHIPRAEDFPIMPSESTGFLISPKGFFNRSPALDIPEARR
jgi:primary-amine oxidase